MAVSIQPSNQIGLLLQVPTNQSAASQFDFTRHSEHWLGNKLGLLR
jgi:hypothetical protein